MIQWSRLTDPSPSIQTFKSWAPLNIIRIGWLDDTQLDGVHRWIGCTNLRVFFTIFKIIFFLFLRIQSTLSFTWVSVKSSCTVGIWGASWLKSLDEWYMSPTRWGYLILLNKIRTHWIILLLSYCYFWPTNCLMKMLKPLFIYFY